MKAITLLLGGIFLGVVSSPSLRAEEPPSFAAPAADYRTSWEEAGLLSSESPKGEQLESLRGDGQKADGAQQPSVVYCMLDSGMRDPNQPIPAAEEVPAEAHLITVGEYVTFLNDHVHALYSNALASQIASEEDGDHYSIAVGADAHDFMLHLTLSDVNCYFDWVEDSSSQPSTSSLPLMMFDGNRKKSGAEKRDPRTTDHDDEGSETEGSFRRAVGGNESSLALIKEAATQMAHQARQHLDVENMPGGDPASRQDRIAIATQISAIADMLVSYVSTRKELLLGHHSEIPPNIPESLFQQPASWNIVVGESLNIAKKALEVATAHHQATEGTLNSYVEELKTAIKASEEAYNKSTSAREGVSKTVIDVVGTIPAAAVGHLGPLLIEGGKLASNAVNVLYKKWQSAKGAEQAKVAQDDLEYAVAKWSALGSIRNSVNDLHDKLAAIPQETEHWFHAAIEEGSNSQSLSEPSLETSAHALRISHAKDLVTWANNNMQQLRQAEITSPVDISVAQSYQTHAQNILDAIQSHTDVLANKETVDQQLALARTKQTALESALYQAKAILERTQAALDAVHPKSSITGTRAFNYKESREYKEKHAAKIKVKELEDAVKQATSVVAEAYDQVQAAALDLARVEAPLNVWNNLRAWHTVAIASQLKDLPIVNEQTPLITTANLDSPLDPPAFKIVEQDDQKIPQQTKQSARAVQDEEIGVTSDSTDPSHAIPEHLKEEQLARLATDLAEGNKELEKAFRAGKPLEITPIKTAASSVADVNLDTELDNTARDRLMLEHTAYAADRTGVSADIAITRFFDVVTGETTVEPAELVAEALTSSSDHPIGNVVTESLITRGRFEVVNQTGQAAQDAVNAYQKAQAERQKKQAEQFARFRKK